MPDQEPYQTPALEEINAQDFSEQAATIRQMADDWATVKDSMIDWLRDHVGENVGNSLSNLDEEIIKSATDNAYHAQDYLKDTKRNLRSILQDPYATLTTHNNPPREDSDDGISWSIPEILGWDNPIDSEQSEESAESGT